jgi:hypothetical protein
LGFFAYLRWLLIQFQIEFKLVYNKNIIIDLVIINDYYKQTNKQFELIFMGT